jgi:hypothetical protein
MNAFIDAALLSPLPMRAASLVQEQGDFTLELARVIGRIELLLLLNRRS